MRLVVEMAAGGGWREVGWMKPGSMPGSLSHNDEGRRDVIRFSCTDEGGLVLRSRGGVDQEYGPNGEVRVIDSVGFVEVARLAPGEQHEMWLRTDRMDRPARFRFRQEG